MVISVETSTEDLIKQVMAERNCSYQEAIKLLLELARN